MPTWLPQHDPVAGGDGLDVDVPQIGVATDSVGQDERRPLTVLFVIEPDAIVGAQVGHDGYGTPPAAAGGSPVVDCFVTIGGAGAGWIGPAVAIEVRALDRPRGDSVFLNRHSRSVNHDLGVSMKTRLHLTVNGELHDVLVPVHKTLLEVLREDLGLTGTKH